MKTRQQLQNTKQITKDSTGRVRVVTVFTEPSRTLQQFKDKVNVNKIVSKYNKTGLIDHVRQHPGAYLDITQVGDYQEALQKVIKANSIFESLPAEVRKRFSNNPQELVSFLSDKKNLDEAIQLGLVNKPKTSPDQPIASPDPQPKADAAKTKDSKEKA